jgi:hypothetical protein
MKTLSILLTLSAIAFTFSLTSCKKKGCTDELAINYFSENKKDDGSCSYSTTKMEGKYAYTWNDSLVDTADVYSFKPSYLGIYSANGFNFAQTEFRLLVNWSALTMEMPDSMVQDIFPDTARSVTGTISDKNAFTIKYTQHIPTWNNPTVWKDTIITYNFVRI